MLVFIDPIDTVFIEVILFLTSKVNKTKCSRSVPSKYLFTIGVSIK